MSDERDTATEPADSGKPDDRPDTPEQVQPSGVNPDDSSKPRTEDVPSVVSDKRKGTRKSQPDGSGRSGVVPVKSEAVEDDGSPDLPVAAETAHVRSDKDPKADRAPVHNPDPSEPQPAAVDVDGHVLPVNHRWFEDGPTLAPGTDARLAISPHGNTVASNAHPKGVIGNAPEDTIEDEAYSPMDPANAEIFPVVNGSIAAPNPPQYVDPQRSVELAGVLAEPVESGPRLDFTSPSAVHVPQLTDEDREAQRRLEEAADSPHGALADITGNVAVGGAPRDSHGEPRIGGNDHARTRQYTEADLKEASERRRHR